MSIFFKDLGKQAKDLLGKKYTTNGSKKFSVNTKTTDGVGYGASADVQGAKVTGKVTADFRVDNLQENLTLDSSGVLKNEVKLDKILDDIVFKINSESRSITEHDGSIGLEYSNQDFKIDLDVALKKTASASICYKSKDFFVGGSAGAKFSDGFDFSDYDFGVGYTFDKNVVTLKSGGKLSSVKLSGHRQHSSDIAVAGTLTSALSGDNLFPAIELGGSYKIDSDTSLFGKVSVPNFGTKDLTASFALDQKLNSNASLSLTSVLDLDPEHPQNFFGSQFGLELKFGA